MKNLLKKKIIIILMALFSFSCAFQSCDKPIDEIIDDLLNILIQTGWLQDQEEMDNIPEDITPFDDDDNPAELQTKVLLEDKFPPIGDQGQYGTCVVWSVGYNLKTALNAIEKGWTPSDLSKTSNQTSPKDLWMTIPSGKKGARCEGTNFEPALDALIASGSASMSSVPYTGLGNCDGSKVGDGNNKLANYRKIASENEGLTPENFKGYLNAGRPIAIGAQLGDQFMTWNSSVSIKSDTYNNPGMQHAYHAMALVGYDDDKNAFRVRNSWGPSWGDNGSIWVDYDFFCGKNGQKFCFAAFVAQNVNDISVGTGGIEGDLTSGDDLLAFSAVDVKYEDNKRLCSYKVYNSGTTFLNASLDWTVVYMYYNAVDAGEYKIIYEDVYTDKYGGNKGDYGDLPAGVSIALYGGFWNNVDVDPGQLVAGEKFPEGTNVVYPKLSITGDYYLVVMVDSYDVIREANEDNNFYFITAANGKPLRFENGEIMNMPPITKNNKIPATFSNTENQTVVKPGNMNAYTPAEIRTMLLHDKKTGKLDMKMKDFRIRGGQSAVKVKK